MSMIGSLRAFDREVLSRRWVSFMLPLMAVALTAAILSAGATDPLPLWQAILATVVDVTLFLVTFFAWAHHVPIIHRLLYGKPRPTMPQEQRDQILAELLFLGQLVNTPPVEEAAELEADPAATIPIEALQQDEVDLGGEEIST